MPVDPSGDIIERELDLHITAIEKKMEGDVLAFFGPILFGVEGFIRIALEETKKKRKKLIVILETSGGYVEVVQRIADTLRQHYKRVEFVIPDYAMSAGSVLVMDVDYAQLQKIYGAPSDEETRRYSPARCIGSDMKVVSGDPDLKNVSTSYVERHNLTMRMGVRGFTRLANGFSKKIQNHAAMVAIYAVYYNFGRIHKTLRITPSMAAGLSDHVWSLEEIVMMSDSYAPAKRGPYKKRTT